VVAEEGKEEKRIREGKEEKGSSRVGVQHSLSSWWQKEWERRGGELRGKKGGEGRDDLSHALFGDLFEEEPVRG